jgi:pimeloyl-ACP methyl ester carboxylesterase
MPATLPIAVASALTVASSGDPAAAPAPVHFLDRHGGRIAYEDSGGTGTLVICVPGMGDLRSQYRFLAPRLAALGYRLVTMDLRGHGDSSVGFADVSAATVGDDIVAVLEALGARDAVLVGNSMAGAAAVWAAAERPGTVRGVVLLDPFVRDVPASFVVRLAMRIGFLRPWGPLTWASYYKSLHVGVKPADLDAYATKLAANLREPGRLETLRAMMWTSKAACEARLDEVRAPALVVMGTRDPDFADPAAEARWVAGRVDGRVLLVEGAGHYPHVEQPELIAGAIDRFVRAGRQPAFARQPREKHDQLRDAQAPTDGAK